MATGSINRVVPITAGGTGQTSVITSSNPTDFITAGTNVTISSASISVWGKVCTIGVVLKRSTSSAIGTTVNFGTLLSAYKPATTAPLQSTVNGNAFINTSGNLIVVLSEAYTADTDVSFRATFILK